MYWCIDRRGGLFLQMDELKGNALAFIAQNFTAVASLSHDLAGLADSLLTRLAKVGLVMHAPSSSAHCCFDALCRLYLHPDMCALVSTATDSALWILCLCIMDRSVQHLSSRDY